MDLSLQKLTKAFNQKSIFRDLSFTVRSGSRLAITGANGTGKSTLLKIISGGMLPTSGKIEYTIAGHSIRDEHVYRYVHFVAPYNTVIEELTLAELFALHHRLGLLGSFPDLDSWTQKLEYGFRIDQQIKMFSSGMKQRIKLGLALLDDRPLILLDEPGSNLDRQGKSWLSLLLNNLSEHQTLILATNDLEEREYCHDEIEMGPGSFRQIISRRDP